MVLVVGLVAMAHGDVQRWRGDDGDGDCCWCCYCWIRLVDEQEHEHEQVCGVWGFLFLLDLFFLCQDWESVLWPLAGLLVLMFCLFFSCFFQGGGEEGDRGSFGILVKKNLSAFSMT